jgi:hypothetical protein
MNHNPARYEQPGSQRVRTVTNGEVWSGIGGTVLTLVVTVLIYAHSRRKTGDDAQSAGPIPQPAKARDHNRAPFKSTRINATEAGLQPREILNDISSRPPFQHKEAEHHYVGFDVAWNLCLVSAPEWQNRNVVDALFCEANKETNAAWVEGDVDVEANPDIKIAHASDVLLVRGKICGFRGSHIVLADIRVTRTGSRLP